MGRRGSCIHDALGTMLNNKENAEKQGLILLLYSFTFRFC